MTSRHEDRPWPQLLVVIHAAGFLFFAGVVLLHWQHSSFSTGMMIIEALQLTLAVARLRGHFRPDSADPISLNLNTHA